MEGSEAVLLDGTEAEGFGLFFGETGLRRGGIRFFCFFCFFRAADARANTSNWGAASIGGLCGQGKPL